jgi:hypothetical protein
MVMAFDGREGGPAGLKSDSGINKMDNSDNSSEQRKQHAAAATYLAEVP